MPRPDMGQIIEAAGHIPGLLKHTDNARKHVAEIGKEGKSKGQRVEHGLEITVAVASGALLARRLWQALKPSQEQSSQE